MSNLTPFIGAIVSCTIFALGWFSSLYFRRKDKLATDIHEHVAAINSLTTKWYNQLLELNSEMIGSKSEQEAERAAYAYVNNRYVLPDLLLHLEFLRLRGQAHEVVEATEKFLSVVTDAKAKPLPHSSILSCELVLSGEAGPEIRREPLPALLSRLDRHVQQITKLSAQAMVGR